MATVADVMTSRVDLAAVEVMTPLEDVLKLFAEKAHSRMPVYRDSLDEPLGLHPHQGCCRRTDAHWLESEKRWRRGRWSG